MSAQIVRIADAVRADIASFLATTTFVVTPTFEWSFARDFVDPALRITIVPDASTWERLARSVHVQQVRVLVALQQRIEQPDGAGSTPAQVHARVNALVELLEQIAKYLLDRTQAGARFVSVEAPTVTEREEVRSKNHFTSLLALVYRTEPQPQ